MLACRAAIAWAHDPGISTAQGELRRDVLVLSTGFAPADVQHLLQPGARTEGAWTHDEFETVREPLTALAPQLWEVRMGGAPVSPREVSVKLLAGDNVSFELVFPRAPGVEGVALRAPKVAELPAGHRQFVIVTDERGSTIAKKLLSARDFVLDLPSSPPTSGLGPGAVAPSAAVVTPPEAESPEIFGFLRLGVEHIWTGYDHLLFLFALLLVCQSVRSIVTIVTCFTLAHSITLALATLNLVNMPARWVEPAIAASIVFVGAENLWRRGAEPRGRWALTFAFGLVHGFGFASVLRDLGVGGDGGGIAIPLLTFNLGVELGQIVIAAVVLPFVWRWRKNPWFLARGVPALSALVTAAGLFWLLQRTVFA